MRIPSVITVTPSSNPILPVTSRTKGLFVQGQWKKLGLIAQRALCFPTLEIPSEIRPTNISLNSNTMWKNI